MAELTVRGSHDEPTQSGRVRRVLLLGTAAEALARLPGPRTGPVFPGVWAGQPRRDDGVLDRTARRQRPARSGDGA